MKTMILDAIAQLKSLFNPFRLKQFAGVALAGFFLMFSTACSSGVNAQTPEKGPSYRSDSSYRSNIKSDSASNPYSGTMGTQRELYKPTQKKVGGINNYNDDPKYDNDATQVQKNKLINQVERNLKKQADDPQELVQNIRDRNPLDDKAREVSRNVKSATQDLKTDLSEGTKRGVKNIQANTERAKDNLPHIFEEAKQNASGAGDDFRDGVRDLSTGAKRAVDRASSEIQDKA